MSDGPVLERINRGLPTLRRSERKVADVVLADPHKVVPMTLAELAEAAGVSQPTIVRFANAIGCDGFHDFRIQLAQSVALGIPATQSVIQAQDDTGTTVSKIFDFSITSLDHVRRHLDLAAIDAAVAALAASTHIVFVGLGASGIVAMDAEQKFPSSVSRARPRSTPTSSSWPRPRADRPRRSWRSRTPAARCPSWTPCGSPASAVRWSSASPATGHRWRS